MPIFPLEPKIHDEYRDPETGLIYKWNTDEWVLYTPAAKGIQTVTESSHTSINSITTTGLSNSLIVSDTSASLLKVTGFSNSDVTQFIHIFDASFIPEEDATPVIVIIAQPMSNFNLDFIHGRYFANGITICNSSSVANKTIGPLNCWFDIQFK